MASFGAYEIVGVVFAILNVLLAIKEYRSCWIAAIISCLAYVPTFYFARLYTEVVLQFFFIALAIVGWINWRKENNSKVLNISSFDSSQHFYAISISLSFAVAFGMFLTLYSNASFPFIDSIVTCFSITTAYMQAKKILENWIYWILIDSLALVMYIKKGMMLTAGLYGLYLILASIGYLEWKKIKGAQTPT